MPETFPFLDRTTRMLTAALEPHLHPGAEHYLDLFADDAVFEFPFAPGGAVRKVGRDEMAAYLRTLEGGTVFDELALTGSYLGDGDDDDAAVVVVLEYDGRGHDQTSGALYVQRYISVVHLAGGRITAFREYFNPLAVL